MIKEFDRIAIGLLTIPFSFGNYDIKKQSRENICLLKNSVEQLLIISIEHVFYCQGKASPEEIALKKYHRMMLTVKTIQQAISGRSAVSIDFWDIRSLSFKGSYGIVIAADSFGENRCFDALEMALDSLTSRKIIREAKSFLLYITYGFDDVTIGKIQDLLDCFMTKISLSADVLWSAGYDHELGENVQVTVIVAGLDVDSIEF